MFQQLKNIWENLGTPLKSAGVILLFFLSLLVLLWIIMIVVRLVLV